MYVTMTIIVYPLLIVVVLVIVILMLLVRRFSLVGTMDSLRYDAITRSPINSMFSASLNGLMTIRAYRRSAYFEAKFLNLVDRNGAAFFTYIASSRWMGYHLDYLSALFILSTTIIAFILRDVVDPAHIALGVTSSMSLLGPLQFLIRQSADVSNSMTSIQRMQEYVSLPSELPA